MTPKRQTNQKAAILRAFERDDRPLSPQEVLESARGDVPSLGVATVYRAIKQLQEDEILKSVGLPDGPPRYELAGKAHHHHFQCRYCDKVYEIFACSGGIKPLTPPGFTLEDHEIMLFGRCADCASRANTRRIHTKSK